MIAAFGEAFDCAWDGPWLNSVRMSCLSALAWGALSVGMVLFCPSCLRHPLILSLSLGDPLFGGITRKDASTQTVIWAMLGNHHLGCMRYLVETLGSVPMMAPICVAAEWPRLRWHDDNATMVISAGSHFRPIFGRLRSSRRHIEELSPLGGLVSMYGDNESKEPPQSVYYTFFGIAAILLANSGPSALVRLGKRTV